VAIERKLPAVLAAGLVVGLIAGAALGVLWWQLAPRVQLVIEPGSVTTGYDTGGYMAADVAFSALGAVAGVAIAVGLARMRREHLAGVLAAAMLASAIGTTAMWLVGTKLGSVDIEGLQATVDQVVVDAPLRVSAPAAYLVWSIASAIVVAVLAATDWLHEERSA
jgi:hypothetical protein